MKKENPLHKLLTTLKAKKKDFYLCYENRPHDITISSGDIAQILKGSFLLEDGETQIPFHRIRMIYDFEEHNILYMDYKVKQNAKM